MIHDRPVTMIHGEPIYATAGQIVSENGARAVDARASILNTHRERLGATAKRIVDLTLAMQKQNDALFGPAPNAHGITVDASPPAGVLRQIEQQMDGINAALDHLFDEIKRSENLA